MDLSLQSIKTNNWSADNFKKHNTSMSCTIEPTIQSGDTGQRIPFLTAVNIDHNTDVYKDVHYQVQTQIAYALDT